MLHLMLSIIGFVLVAFLLVAQWRKLFPPHVISLQWTALMAALALFYLVAEEWGFAAVFSALAVFHGRVYTRRRPCLGCSECRGVIQ